VFFAQGLPDPLEGLLEAILDPLFLRETTMYSWPCARSQSRLSSVAMPASMTTRGLAPGAGEERAAISPAGVAGEHITAFEEPVGVHD